MKSKYITNTSCEKCGSSDGVGVWIDENNNTNGYCFVCERYYDNMNEEELDIKSNNVQAEYSQPKQAISYTYSALKSRGISEDSCKKYGVTVDLDTDGNDIAHYYPFYSNTSIKDKYYCKREIKDKKFFWLNSHPNLQLFGQHLAGKGGKMIIITEGVCDTLAAYEMLKHNGKNYRVVSLCNGAGSAVRDVKNNYEWLSEFEGIYLALDQDEPGKSAADKIAQMFPINKVKVLKFTEKDCNDLLLKGKSKEFLDSIFKANAGHPDGIVGVDELFEEAIKPPVMGKSFPWPSLTEATYGYRPEEVWGVGAPSGGGKTQFFKELINNTIYAHNEIPGVIFLEENAALTLKVLAGLKVNKRFHVPQARGGDWTVEELTSGIDELRDKVYLYNHYGAKDWNSIKEKIRYMVNVLGVKDVYIDHITALVAQEDDEYKAINRIMEEMSSLTQELHITIFYVSHLRKSGNGTTHAEGAKISPDDFKGSGSVSFWSNFLIGLERNQLAEDLEIRHTTTLRILKDRLTGESTGVTIKLKYNTQTGRWLEEGYGEFDEDI